MAVYQAAGAAARAAEPTGEPAIKDADFSFGPEPNIVTSGPLTFVAGRRSDAFFIDFAGILNFFDHKDGTIPHDGLTPHTDLLEGFPFLGTPHVHWDPAPISGG